MNVTITLLKSQTSREVFMFTKQIAKKDGCPITVATDLPQQSIQALPDEVMLLIFSNFEVTDALKSAMVCKKWRTLASDSSLWRHFLERDFGYQPQVGQMGQPPHALYQKKHRSDCNLSRGVFSEKTCELSCESMPQCVNVHNTEIFLGFAELASTQQGNVQNYRIEIWDAKTKKCKKTLIHQEPTASAKSNVMTTISRANEGKLIAGTKDSLRNCNTLIWDLESCGCLMTVPGNSYFTFLKGDQLITHCEKGNIHIWNLHSGEREKTIDRLEKNRLSTAILSPDGKKLIYGIGHRIKVWDLEKGECEQTFRHGHENEVDCFTFTEEGKLVSGGLYVYPKKTKLIIGTYHEYPAKGQEIKIWNLEDGDCEMTLRREGDSNHNKVLIATKSHKLISLSFDGHLTVWNLKNGKCETHFRAVFDKMIAHDRDAFTYTEEGDLILRLYGDLRTPLIKLFEFNSLPTTIYKEIAAVFQRTHQRESNPSSSAMFSDDHASKPAQEYMLAKARFLRMPMEERIQIYRELEKILQSSSRNHHSKKDFPLRLSREEEGEVSKEHNPMNVGEDAFLDQNGFRSKPKQKAQAILNFLSQQHAQIPLAKRAKCTLM